MSDVQVFPSPPREQRLNEELRVREERLSFLLESAGVGTWDWDLRRSTLEWSERCLEMFGIAAGTVMTYERFLAALHPEDRDRVDQAVQSCLSHKQEYNIDMRAVWPDGSTHWVSSRGRAYYDESGEPIRMSGAAMDVTRLKQTEKDLERARAEARAHAENLASVLDAVPALTFFSGDRECRTMTAGRLAREVFGFPDGINVSLSAPEGRQLNFTWLENGRELSADELPVQQAAATGQEVRDKELEVRFPGGKVLHMFGHAVPLFDGAGAVRGAVGALLDITALKGTESELKRARAEAKAQADNLTAIFDAMPAAAFFSHDRKCETVTSNRAAYELLRMPYGSNTSKTGPLAERPSFQVFENGRELPAEELPLQKAAITGEAVRNKELEIRFEDGSSTWEFGHAVPLFNEEGKVRGAVGAFLDVTDRKVIEERLRATTERFQIALRGTAITVFNQGLDLRYRWIHNPVGRQDIFEIIGKRDSELLERPEDWKMTEAIKSEVLRTGVSYQGEMTSYLKGAPRYYHVKIDPQRDPNGHIIGLTGAAFDLTETKDAQAERERLWQQRQLALDAATMGWWHYDVVTRLGAWDDTFKQIFQVESNSLPVEEILRRIQPEDVACMRAEFKAALEATDPKPHFGEYRIVLPDRSVHWVEIYAAGEYEGEGAGRRILGCSGTVRDVTERKATELALRASEARYRQLASNLDAEVQARTRELEKRNQDLLRTSEQVRKLSSHLLQLQDQERRRIARELHDSSGQLLTAIGMDLANLAEQAQDARVREIAPGLAPQVEETEKLVQRLHRELRTTSYLLHPPLLDEAGLSSAVGWYVQGVGQRGGIAIELDISSNFGRLPRDLELVVFRVVQEGLTNIHRHSGSKRASIRISRDASTITLQIEDYGKGIPAEQLAAVQSGLSGLGIRAMRERLRPFQGELQISSSGTGTRVLVTIPQPVALQEKNTAEPLRATT